LRERELRRRCKRELQALGIRPPLRVEELCERLGERRGREIRLMPLPLPADGPFGLWIATEAADHIIYQRETSKAHQDHIVLHEVGHILADHHGVPQDESWQPSVAGIPAESIERVLHRSSYDAQAEREAELVATIILDWASVMERVSHRPASNPSVQRIQTALGDRRGWL
jgi:hypothetical protein